MAILEKSFFLQDTKKVAQKLLGKKLIREINGKKISGIISETEAYLSTNDSACHACNGKTKRNAPMFAEGGVAYIYLIYGVHYMLNFVTEKKNMPSAVLIRSIIPLENIAVMQKLRNLKNSKNLSNGPGKLCKALNIDIKLNRHKLFTREKLWIEDTKDISLKNINKSPRIGINYANKKDREALLRFYI